MSDFRTSGNIKLSLFFVGLILIVGLLAYSNSIVNRLRDDNREIVKVYSEIIAKTVNEVSDSNLNFVLSKVKLVDSTFAFPSLGGINIFIYLTYVFLICF